MLLYITIFLENMCLSESVERCSEQVDDRNKNYVEPMGF